jgi:hypothetical protein
MTDVYQQWTKDFWAVVGRVIVHDRISDARLGMSMAKTVTV